MDPRVLAYFALTSWNTVAEILLNDEKSFFATVLLLKTMTLLWVLFHGERKLTYATRVTIAIAMGFTVAFWLNKAPHVWESDLWCVQNDLVMMIWLLTTDQLEDASVPCQTILEQFSFFYLASGVFKLNTNFLDPDTSCGTLFAAQHIAYFLSFLPFDSLVSVMTRVKPLAPILAILVEVAMGGSLLMGRMLNSRRWMNTGLLLIFYFHLLVCLTPKPLDISNFGLMCGVRLVALLEPSALEQVLQMLRPAAIQITIVAMLSAAWGISYGFTPLNWAFALFVPVLFLHQLVIWFQPPTPLVELKETTQRRPTWTKFFSAFACFYSFGHLMLGLQEESSCNMFSSLSVHGGSNHLFLPTGLLFHAFQKSPDSHPFGGGVIRIESTTSNWLRTIYPADLSHVLEPTATLVPLLKKVHTATPIYFSPGANRVLGLIERGWVKHAGEFLQYTVPALEFKRLFKEAKSKDGTFTLTYAKLPGTIGDEIWRAKAVEKRVKVNVKDGEIVRCKVQRYLDGRQASKTQDCVETDLPYQLNVPWVLRKFSIYFGYAIIFDELGQPRKSMSCVD